MKSINQNESTRPWYKEQYVWMVIFFPMLAVIGGFAMLYMAIETYDGLVVDDYYKKGLEINRVLERDKSASAYQLVADVSIERQMEEVEIKFSANSDFVYPTSIDVSFLHATRAGLDKQVKLLKTQDKMYQGNLPALEPGKWYVHIQQDDWRIINIINVPKYN